jgi:hypothetical protein
MPVGAGMAEASAAMPPLSATPTEPSDVVPSSLRCSSKRTRPSASGSSAVTARPGLEAGVRSWNQRCRGERARRWWSHSSVRRSRMAARPGLSSRLAVSSFWASSTSSRPGVAVLEVIRISDAGAGSRRLVGGRRDRVGQAGHHSIPGGRCGVQSGGESHPRSRSTMLRRQSWPRSSLCTPAALSMVAANGSR